MSNHLSIAYVLSNICTKNFWNRTTIVEIIDGGWVVSFFETQCRRALAAAHTCATTWLPTSSRYSDPEPNPIVTLIFPNLLLHSRPTFKFAENPTIAFWVILLSDKYGCYACWLPPHERTDGCPAGRRFRRPAVRPYVPYDSQHVLQPLLPNRRADTHFLRERRQDFQLFCKSNSITGCNFIARLLFKDSYWP